LEEEDEDDEDDESYDEQYDSEEESSDDDGWDSEYDEGSAVDESEIRDELENEEEAETEVGTDIEEEAQGGRTVIEVGLAKSAVTTDCEQEMDTERSELERTEPTKNLSVFGTPRAVSPVVPANTPL